jgi:16S rRNA (uracil1498-N3)-methyltransferase
VILEIDAAATRIRAAAPERIAPLPPRIRALLPAIKGERMAACLEKLVEVGVDEIVIWPAARAVARVAIDRREARGARLAATVQAAARQCGRPQVPSVTFAADLAGAIADAPAPPGLRVALDPGAALGLAALAFAAAPAVAVISGPEGGLAPEEREALARAGFAAAGLGPRVLRAETAPVVAVAVIRALTGT